MKPHNFKNILILAVLYASYTNARSSETLFLNYPDLCFAIYKQNTQFWGSNSIVKDSVKSTIRSLASNSIFKGLDPQRYHLSSLRFTTNDSSKALYYIDAAVTYCKDLVKPPAGNFISYDEISSKYIPIENEQLVSAISTIESSSSLLRLVESFEPNNEIYQRLLKELKIQLDSNNSEKISALKNSIVYLRWISHFRFQRHIVVNIGSATLTYFEANKELLTTRVVVGKKATKTPRFAAYCNSVVLYPYWHVPRSIAVNEILPLCKKSAGILDMMDIQVLNSKGVVINPYSVNWKVLNKRNFSYTFRQSTGCGNALGVLKFNLTDPFNVYIHDTNFKGAFRLTNRYLSHGCIRLEKPLELANYILPHKVDSVFLAACVHNQTPVTKEILNPVPVFVIYDVLEPDTSGVRYINDVYDLM